MSVIKFNPNFHHMKLFCHTNQDTERIRIERTADEVSLTIKKVMRTDDGEYSFRMTNAAGEETCYAKLYVQQPVE
jgi:hypothetical protein